MTSSMHGRSFDPFSQPITMRGPDGTPFQIHISDIDFYVYEAVRICVNYGTQIGASLILLLVVLLITHKEKRSSAHFWFNISALVLNVIRTILQVLYFTGPWYEFYAQFTYDFSRVPQTQYNISITADVFTFLLVVCLEISLMLQASAVYSTTANLWRYLLLGFTGLVGLSAIAWRLALTVINCKAILSASDFYQYEWLARTSTNITTGSICFFSAIFVGKLFTALYQRKKMGLAQFGPMQVLFIMGCQCLLIPAIFSILQNITTVPDFSTQLLTLTAIFLPLSSLWASAIVTKDLSFKGPNGSRKFFNFSFRSDSSYSTEKGGLVDKFDTQGTTISTKVSDFDRDLEAQGIYVTNTCHVAR